MFSCAPSISLQTNSKRAALTDSQNVVVYNENEAVSQNFTLIGNVSLGDSGFTTNCDFETMINIAKNEARKIGGNALKITKHILPSFFGSSCHRIQADILDISQNVIIDSLNKKDSDTLKKSQSKINITNTSTPDLKLTRFILSSNFGYGYRLAKLPSSFNKFEQDYYGGLKSGYNYDLSIYYRLKSKSSYGFGIKYNVFNSSNTANNIVVTNNKTGIVLNGSISDDITLTFTGLSYIYDFKNSNSRHEFFSEFSFGLLNYKNYSKIINDNYLITGSTFGSFIGLGYNYRVAKNLSIGPQVSYINGNLSGFDVVGPNGIKETIKLPKDTLESLGRIDLTFHCLYRF